MHCEQCETLLPLLVFDEIEDGDKAQVLEHLSHCGPCTEKLGDLRVTFNLLREGIAAQPAPMLSQDRRHRLMTALAKEPRRSKRKLKRTDDAHKRFRLFTTGSPSRRLLAIAATLAISTALVGLFLPALGSPRRTARRMQNGTQARSIQQGLVLDSQSRGRYTDDLVDLVDGGYVTPEYLIAPEESGTKQVPSDFKSWSREKKSGWINENSSYTFVQPGAEESNDARRVVVFEKPREGADGINIVYDDNHVEYKSLAEADKEIRQSTGKSISEWKETNDFGTKLSKAQQNNKLALPALIDNSRSMNDASGPGNNNTDGSTSFRTTSNLNGVYFGVPGESLAADPNANSPRSNFNSNQGQVSGGGGGQSRSYHNSEGLTELNGRASGGVALSDFDGDRSGVQTFNKPLAPPIVQSLQKDTDNYTDFANRSGKSPRSEMDEVRDRVIDHTAKTLRDDVIADPQSNFFGRSAPGEERHDAPSGGRSVTKSKSADMPLVTATPAPSTPAPASPGISTPAKPAGGPMVPAGFMPPTEPSGPNPGYAGNPPDASQPRSVSGPSNIDPPRKAEPARPSPPVGLTVTGTAPSLLDGKPGEQAAPEAGASDHRGFTLKPKTTSDENFPLTRKGEESESFKSMQDQLAALDGRKLPEKLDQSIIEHRYRIEDPNKPADGEEPQLEQHQQKMLEKRIDEQPLRKEIQEQRALSKDMLDSKSIEETLTAPETKRNEAGQIANPTQPGKSAYGPDLSIALGAIPAPVPTTPLGRGVQQSKSGEGKVEAESAFYFQEETKKFDSAKKEPLGLNIPTADDGITRFQAAPEFDLNAAIDQTKSAGSGKAGEKEGTTLFGDAEEDESERSKGVKLQYQRESQDSKDAKIRSLTTERERGEQVQRLLERASELRKTQDYDRSLQVINQALFVDPGNPAAESMKMMIEDTQIATKSSEYMRLRNLRVARHSMEMIEATVPYNELITYPSDWPALTASRFDIRELGESEINQRVTAKLQEPLAVNYQGQKLVNVIDDLRNKTGINYFVNWEALESAGIEQSMPITLKLDKNLPADQAFRLVLQQAGAGNQLEPIGFSIVDGIVTVSTEKDLKSSVEVTVYELKTLVDNADVAADSRALERMERDVMLRDLVSDIAQQVTPQQQQQQQQVDARHQTSVREINGNVIVRATREQHQQIQTKLRNAFGKQRNAAADAVRNDDAPVNDQGQLQPAASFRIMPVNAWTLAQEDAQSTFALDVDTASYTLGRRYLQRDYLPPQGSVRMEEYVNAFDYNYVNQSDQVFRIFVEGAPAPFATVGEHDTKLVKVGIKGKVIGRDGRKPANLVLVVDTSGSMARPDRLPLVQHSLELLTEQLSPHDTVSLVTFGSQVMTLLDRTPASNKQQIIDAIRSLQSNGPTNLLKGIEAGYQLAASAHKSGAINRVILCSDGIATLGETEADTILQYVENYRKQGISCTTVGVGAGAYDDDMMEKLANKGDGMYYFIDSQREAKRVFVDEITSTLQTIAKDAKIQVEFNPQRVRRYRLIGYENRAVADKDFRNDTIDAGEVGSGQSSTALYEVELIGDERADLGTVYVRYRNADTEKIEEISHRLSASLMRDRSPQSDPRFYLAACAAEFAEVLRGSEHAADGNLAKVQAVLEQTVTHLPLDEKAQELLGLVRKAQGLPRAP